MKSNFFWFALFICSGYSDSSNIPIVITTWNFENAASQAWQVLYQGGTSLDAVERGGSTCEEQQCDGTVGYGGSPDENGETTLDAMIMDGKNMNVGAVAVLRQVKNAISVARHVLDHTSHSFLVGELATQFAIEMGFKKESLNTEVSKDIWLKWRNQDNCQPNFWINVYPDSTKQCGPYHATKKSKKQYKNNIINRYNHDTIGLVAIDSQSDVAAGTSTNGAKFKIPGRVGDSPIPGSGAYADNDVGGAAATGDGDVMLRFLPSFLAVEEMRRGATPSEAAKTVVNRISQKYPEFMGAVIAVNKNGDYGAACHGIETFPYVVKSNLDDTDSNKVVKCEQK